MSGLKDGVQSLHYSLTLDQKQQRVDYSERCLELFQRNKRDFLSKMHDKRDFRTCRVGVKCEMAARRRWRMRTFNFF